MKISIIIAFYKNLEALKIVLESLRWQTHKDFEIVMAEDDNSKKL